MNYELAKKLKDAGWQQKGTVMVIPGNTRIRCTQDKHCYCHRCTGEEYAIEPTLSELIEACGAGFDLLERWIPEEAEWRAMMSDEAFAVYSRNYPCEKDCCGYQTGDTPEQAVANLWLKLHEEK